MKDTKCDYLSCASNHRIRETNKENCDNHESTKISFNKVNNEADGAVADWWKRVNPMSRVQVPPHVAANFQSSPSGGRLPTRLSNIRSTLASETTSQEGHQVSRMGQAEITHHGSHFK